MKRKTQIEAVIEIMEKNGGFATLGYLYKTVLSVPYVSWNTKTPFASIRRIVQNGKYFFKIKPGLWALKSFEDKLPSDIFPKQPISDKQQAKYNHSYYQGLLVDIGNLKGFGTFIPNQDGNKPYLGKTLFDISTIKKIYQFSFQHFVKRAQTVDTIWFNNRKMPSYLFEVEHTTNFQNSLLKYVDLQDFNVKFYIVSDENRKKEFESKLSFEAFKPIHDRVNFLSYNNLADWHSATYKYKLIEKGILNS